MKAIYNRKKLIEKHWYGDTYEDEYIDVEVLGESRMFGQYPICIIKLPSGEIIKVDKYSLFYESKN